MDGFLIVASGLLFSFVAFGKTTDHFKAITHSSTKWIVLAA
jgi:hypothetical protein